MEDYIATRSTVGLHQFQPAMHSNPAPAQSPAQQDTERQLDLQDFAEWEQQVHTQREANTTGTHARPQINDELPQTQKARRETPPSYDQFLADLRRQDETLKHLYPRSPQTQQRTAKAA